MVTRFALTANLPAAGARLAGQGATAKTESSDACSGTTHGTARRAGEKAEDASYKKKALDRNKATRVRIWSLCHNKDFKSLGCGLEEGT